MKITLEEISAEIYLNVEGVNCLILIHVVIKINITLCRISFISWELKEDAVDIACKAL